MFKIYLVDDEEFILEELKVLIDWQEYGYEICGLNTNPLLAKEEILSLKPDFVLCDILMSAKNGTELAKEVKLINPKVDFCFLSAFNVFEYAKNAIQVGAYDYLLKPISLEELKRVLKKYRNNKEKEHICEYFNHLFKDAKMQEREPDKSRILPANKESSEYFAIALSVTAEVKFPEDYSSKIIFSQHYDEFVFQIVENLNVEKALKMFSRNNIRACVSKGFKGATGLFGHLKEVESIVRDFLGVSAHKYTVVNDNVYSDVIREILNDIEIRYVNPDLTINSYTDQYHYSLTYLSRLFTKEVGCSFTKYLVNYRIGVAKNKLKNKNLTLSGVAYSVGYLDYCQFSKIFKKYVGCSPTCYRNRFLK